MNRQFSLKLSLFVVVLAVSTTAIAEAGNVCQLTSQNGLNSCRKNAQGDYWTAIGMCANTSDSQSRQACILKAKSDYKDAITTCEDQFTSRNQICQKLGGGPYDPTIDPANFTTNIDNPYLPLKPGTTYIYEGPTSQGFIRNTFVVTTNTKRIDGVTCVEVHDQVFTDGQLTEDTLDWFAQDVAGNVWYFGENTHELVDGLISTIDGTFMGGVDGAKPGIIMEAAPAIGDFYRQEFDLNNAEDFAEVVSLTESVTVPTGSYSNCLKTKETTPLEPDLLESKFYAPHVGNILTIDETTGERSELIQITTGG